MLVTLQTVQEIPMCVNFSPALVSQCVVYSTVFYKVVLTCGTVYHFLSVQCIQIEFQAQVGTPRATPPPHPPHSLLPADQAIQTEQGYMSHLLQYAI